MNNVENMLNKMIFIISSDKNTFSYNKKIGKRHLDCFNEFSKDINLGIKFTSEYDAMIKLAKLGYCSILNTGKTESGYEGVCLLPENLSEEQKNFFNDIHDTLKQFNIFEISFLKGENVFPIQDTSCVSDVNYFFDNYIDLEQQKRK